MLEVKIFTQYVSCIYACMRAQASSDDEMDEVGFIYSSHFLWYAVRLCLQTSGGGEAQKEETCSPKGVRVRTCILTILITV